MADIKINLSELKKSDAPIKKRGKLSDDELGNVSGGFWETQGYATNYWVVCPNCGRNSECDFTSYIDYGQACDFYTCVCGKTFAVDGEGFVYI